MRKVIFGVANSLDNFIARRDHGVDWLMWSDEVNQLMVEFWPKIDTILMGRKTYEISRQLVADGEEQLMPPVRTYVFSRTVTTTDEPHVEIVSQNAGAFVRELKAQPGKDICCMGGGELAQTLLEADVIDEIGLNIHPILLGDGIPLFHSMRRELKLQLCECRPFKNGCVLVRYDVIHR